jgi:gliding motility-associated-like protein
MESNCIAVQGSSVVIGGQTKNFNSTFAKYDTTGKLVKTISSKNKPFTTRYQEVTAVGIDQNGNIIGGGDFRDSLTFGSTQITKFKGSSNDYDGFLVKFDKNLKVQWMDRLGDGSFKNREKVNDVHVEDNGRFYATGEYVDSLFYRSNSYSGGAQGATAFVGEFQSNGTLNWFSKVTASGVSNAIGNGVATTADSVFAVGKVNGSSASFGSKTRTVNGSYGDDYVAKLDKKGNFKYAVTSNVRSGGFGKKGSFSPPNDIGLDSNGAAYISGGYAVNISFGSQFISGKSENYITKLTNQRIILDTLSDSTFCPGDSVQAPFTVVGQFDSGNTFTAQLSDSSGQFQSPILLDSVQGQTGDTIRTIIPETVPADSQYRIRIVSDAPANTSNLNPATLTIKKQPGLSVNDMTVSCGRDSVKPNVTTSGSQFSWSPDSAVSNPTTKRPYVFTSADTVSLEVKDSIGCVNRDTLTVTIESDSLQPPDLTMLNTQSTSSIKVQWDTPDSFPNFKRYVLYQKAAKQQTFSAVDSIPTFDSTSLLNQTLSATDSQTYDYFIRAQNGCGTLSEASDTLRSIALQKQILSDKKLRVKWNPSLFDDSFKYKVAYDPGSGFQLDTTLYQDTAYKRIACNNSGTYEITALDTISSDTVIANQISPAIKDTTPPTANLLSASRFGQGKEATYRLTLDQSDSGDFKASVVYQSVNQGSYQPIDTISKRSGIIQAFSQSAYPDSNSVCFRIQPEDTCGVQGPRSSPHCLVDLQGQPGNKQNQLSWTPYQGFQADTITIQRLRNSKWQAIASLATPDTTFAHKGLQCSQTYRYRIKHQEARGSGQVSYSDSFRVSPFDTTKPAVPNLLSVSFDFNWNGVARLEWDHASSNADRYVIYRDGTAIDTTYQISDSTFSDKFADPIDKPYCYRVRAENVTCDSVYGATSGKHCLSLLQAKRIRCDSAIELTWNPYIGTDWSPPVPSLDSTKYSIGIKTDSTSGLKPFIGSVDSGVTRFVHTDAELNKLYIYQMSIKGFAGSPYSSTVNIVNKEILPDSPVVLGASKVATSSSNGKVKLSWRELSDQQGVAYYRVYHKKPSANTFQLLQGSIPLTQDSLVHQGLNTRSQDHQYYLTAVDSCGRESDSSGLHQTMDLSIQIKELQHKLNWRAYEGFAVQGYRIQRASGDGPFYTIGNLTVNRADFGTSFIDSSVQCQQTYSYRIVAFGTEDGQLALSDTVTRTAFDNTPPDKPDLHRVSVTNTDNASGQVDLLFRGAPQDNLKGYTVHRAGENNSFQPIDQFRIEGTEDLNYLDERVNTYEQAQAYYLTAYDGCDNVSLPSDTHRTINLSADPENGYIQLSWNSYFGWGLRTYELQRKDGLNSWKTIQKLETGELSHRDSQVICNNIYQYRVIGRTGDTSYKSFSNTDTAKAYKIKPPDPPAIRRVSVTTTGQSTGAIQLTWDRSSSADVLRYHLYRKAQDQQSYQLIDSVQGFRYRDSPINTADQSYTYKLKAIDQCLILSDRFSDPHRSIHLAANGGEEQVKLTWNAYRGAAVEQYEVWRGDTVRYTIPPGRTSLIDKQVTCDTAYQYQVRAVLSEGNRVSWSNTDRARDIRIESPKPPYLQRATVTSFNDVAGVKWQESPEYSVTGYEVFRERGNRLSQIGQIDDRTQTTVIDSFPIPEQQPVCYYVRALNECGQESKLSNQGCLMQPRAEALTRQNRLSWPAYQQWEKGVKAYALFKQLANGTYTSFAALDSNARTYPDDKLRDSANQFCYYIRAKGFGEETYSRSTRVCLKQSAVVYIPNTFSPGVTPQTNDRFGPEGLYIDNYEMQIYNRWGEQVFRTSESEKWDGTYQGEVVPGGVYHYQLIVTSDNGQQKTFNGQVTVIR